MYYIYHITKRKEWGCTTNLNKRLNQLGYIENDLDRLIIVGNIQKASEMEKELNLEYGYGWSERHDYRIITKLGKPFSKNSQSKGGITQSSRLLNCPHCNKSGKGMIMFKWHFDRCRFIK